MAQSLSLSFYDLHTPQWPRTVAAVRDHLGAPHNPLLLPDYFLEVVLPKLGGAAAAVLEGESPVGYVFLLPRGIENGRRVYTMRVHPLPGHSGPSQGALVRAAESCLPGCRVIVYDPAAPHTFQPSHRRTGPIDIGRPSAAEAEQIPRLQQVIWDNPPDMLYPADIHSLEFGLGTSLVARVDGKLAGFLCGFHKFGGPALPPGWAARLRTDLRLESQIMGVLPAYRGRRIGFLLKRTQAEQARAAGIDLVNWTVDPLQFPNAVLNFVHLRAVAFDFHPNLYHFRNDLNQVAPSRFSVTWPISSQRVGGALAGEDVIPVVDLARHQGIVRVNRGCNRITFGVDAPLIAVEIPADWTGLQGADTGQAQRWRGATDELFLHYVGPQPGRYIITAAGVEGPRRYLIGEQASEALLERLVR